MGAWWISWIDFPFSCRKIYILLTCYVTVTEASKQVKCIRWTWLPCFFFFRKILIIHGRDLIPVSEWWSGLSGGLDYDWAGQAPPAAPLIVDAIRSDKYWDPDTSHFTSWIVTRTSILTRGLVPELKYHCCWHGPRLPGWCWRMLSPICILY